MIRFTTFHKEICVHYTKNISNSSMNNGTVKFFNDTKGFGFIKDANSNDEYFVHVSGLNDEIRENDEVTFDLQEGKKGINAVNVKLA
jgi:cold shock protein